MLHRLITCLATATILATAPGCSAQPSGAKATAASGTPVHIDIAAPGCTRAAAAVRPFVRPRHEEKRGRRIGALDGQLRAQKYDVLFMGDSIVQRWPQASLEAAFPGQKVLNLGVGGERVADMLYRLKSALGTQAKGGEAPGITEYRQQAPKVVAVLIGTNDLRGKSTCYIADGTVQIAEALRTLYPKARIVFLGIIPRGNPQGQFAEEIAQVNAAVAATARSSRQFETVDISAAYRCKSQQPCDVAEAPNFLHPTDRGYALLSPPLRDYMTGKR